MSASARDGTGENSSENWTSPEFFSLKIHFMHKDRTTLSKSEIHRPRLLNVLGGAEED